MKISLNWIKEFADVKVPVDKMVEKIGAQLGGVEEVIDLGKKYDGILVAKVVGCEAHPNADKLSLCTIDDAGKAKSVKRNEHGHVQVVCGAPNVRRDMLVAWLPPGTVVPSTIDKDPLVLEAREIRGQMSNGMLASASELSISDNHDGILEIDEKAKPGDSFAEVYKLNDHIIDIENKMFTHRPDCFGMLGVAREIAGINGQSFKSPDWYLKPKAFPKPKGEKLPLEVKNELPKLAPRFMVIAIAGVKVKPSPVWLQTYLMRVGVKPINNIVDLTNYYMLLTGQPLHAYDYDKVGKQIIVRYPKKGEKITLLGGKEIQPHEKAIVIATQDKLIGIGGVMGGAETEVSNSTKNIILECANFDMYSVRRSAMIHGLFTEAVTRFTKGQSPHQNLPVLNKIIDEICQNAGGQLASDEIDISNKLFETQAVKVSPDFINVRLGLNLTAAQITKLLQNVEFKVLIQGQTLHISPPFWRTDINIAEDVVEEVGRLHGYDKLPQTLPKRDLNPAAPNEFLTLKAKLRNILSKLGANDVLTYSFVHGNLMEKAEQDFKQAFWIANALSPDLQYYRTSLTPSLLDKVHTNIKAGFDSFALFEVNKVHDKSQIDKDGLPNEEERLSLVFAAEDKYAKQNYSGAPYYQAANYLVELLSSFGISPTFVSQQSKEYKSVTLNECLAPFEPKRTAYVMAGDELIGVFGEYKQVVKKNFKLPNFVAGFELNIEQIVKTKNQGSYLTMPRFPKIEQDISLKVPVEITYQDLFDFIWAGLIKNQPENVYSTLTPVDIFQREDDAKHKQITLRLTIAAYNRTLTSEIVNETLDIIAMSAGKKFGAERV